jgi:hypothetical protein
MKFDELIKNILREGVGPYAPDGGASWGDRFKDGKIDFKVLKKVYKNSANRFQNEPIPNQQPSYKLLEIPQDTTADPKSTWIVTPQSTKQHGVSFPFAISQASSGWKNLASGGSSFYDDKEHHTTKWKIIEQLNDKIAKAIETFNSSNR